MQQQIESLVKLNGLFPLYPFACKQAFNEHTMVNGVLFREAIITLGKNPSTKHEITMFMKEVNQKVLKINNPTYLNRFKQLIDMIDSGVITSVSKPVEEPVRKRTVRQPVSGNKLADDDEDVDDKPPKPVKKTKKVSSEETSFESPIVKPKKKKPVKEDSPVSSSDEEEKPSVKHKVVKRNSSSDAEQKKRPVEEDEEFEL